jgi:hypothetical protein
MSDLMILHAPGYAPRMTLATVARAERTNADSIGYSEAYKVAHMLGVNNDYRDVVGHSQVNTRKVNPSLRGDAGDNPISVRGDHHLQSAKVEKITNPGTPLKYAPERWGTRATYEWTDSGGLFVTHISVHPSPLFTGIRRWRRVMRWASAEVQEAHARGELVVLTGDMNSRFASAFLRPGRIGLRPWRVGIDYIFYDRRLLLAEARTLAVNGMDHPWMLGTFTLRPQG